MEWIIVFIGIVGLGFLFRYLKKQQDEAEERFEERFADKKIRFMDK